LEAGEVRKEIYIEVRKDVIDETVEIINNSSGVTKVSQVQTSS
jgi:hypothetical protein